MGPSPPNNGHLTPLQWAPHPHTMVPAAALAEAFSRILFVRGGAGVVGARARLEPAPARVCSCAARLQGLTLVRVRAQLEQLQDTFVSSVGLHGVQNSSS